MSEVIVLRSVLHEQDVFASFLVRLQYQVEVVTSEAEDLQRRSIEYYSKLCKCDGDRLWSRLKSWWYDTRYKRVEQNLPCVQQEQYELVTAYEALQQNNVLPVILHFLIPEESKSSFWTLYHRNKYVHYALLNRAKKHFDASYYSAKEYTLAGLRSDRAAADVYIDGESAPYTHNQIIFEVQNGTRDGNKYIRQIYDNLLLDFEQFI